MLLKSIKCNSVEVIKLLIDAGVALESVDRDGNTALLVAAKNGYFAIIELLVASGANVNHCNKVSDAFVCLNNCGLN